jgi:hypothetical protein
MKPISFHTFEQQIAPNTLKAGLKLFEAGQVEPLETLPGGKLEAQVWDGEMFELRMDIAKEAVQKWQCSCGARGDGHCAHLSAVIFKLAAADLGFSENETPKGKKKAVSKKETASKGKKASVKKQTPSQQLETVLHHLPHDALVKIISSKAQTDPAYLLALLAEFGEVDEVENSKIYVDLIADLVKKHKGRMQYVEPPAVRAFCKELQPVVKQLNHLLQAKALPAVAKIVTILYDALIKMEYHATDHVAALEKLLEWWDDFVEALRESIILEEDEKARQVLFNFSLKNLVFKPSHYRHDVVHFCELAGSLCHLPADVEALEQAVADYPRQFSSGNEQTQMQEIVLATYQRFGNAEKVAAYELHRNYSSAERNRRIDEAIKAGELNKAITLLENGLRSDDLDEDDLEDWQNSLLELYLRRDGKSRAAARASKLYVESEYADYDYLLTFITSNSSEKELEALSSQLYEQLLEDPEGNFLGLVCWYRFQHDWHGLVKYLMTMQEANPNIFAILMELDWKELRSETKDGAELLINAARYAMRQTMVTNVPHLTDLTLLKLRDLGAKVAARDFLHELIGKYQKFGGLVAHFKRKLAALGQQEAF